jgi:hypothetical protein
VKYLIEVHGVAKFREAYRVLKVVEGPGLVSDAEEGLREIYGEPLTEMKQEWLGRLCAAEAEPAPAP